MLLMASRILGGVALTSSIHKQMKLFVRLLSNTVFHTKSIEKENIKLGSCFLPRGEHSSYIPVISWILHIQCFVANEELLPCLENKIHPGTNFFPTLYQVVGRIQISCGNVHFHVLLIQMNMIFAIVDCPKLIECLGILSIIAICKQVIAMMFSNNMNLICTYTSLPWSSSLKLVWWKS